MVIVAADYNSAREKGVAGLFLQLDEHGFFGKVILVSPYIRRDRRIVLSDRHELREFGLGSGRAARVLLAPLHLLRLVSHCVAIVRRERIDIIRATEPTLCGLVAWATAWLTGVPYCVSLHADYDKRVLLDGSRGAPTLFGSRVLIRPLERLTLRGAARVLPIRDSLVPYALARGVDPRRVRIIPHGIDLALYERPPAIDVRNVLGLPANRKILAFAGRLSPENYVDEMLDAVCLLAQRRDDFVLVLAGGGVLADAVARRLSADPPLARVVRPVGWVAQDVVRALRFACEASVCLMGGFSLIEACAAGRPVVSYDVEWHRELVIDGRTGRLLKEHDVAGVAAAIETLLDDPAAAARMGKTARRLAHEAHSLERTSATKRSVYAEILDSAASRSA